MHCWKEEDDWVCLYDDFVALDETNTCNIGERRSIYDNFFVLDGNGGGENMIELVITTSAVFLTGMSSSLPFIIQSCNSMSLPSLL